MINANTTATKKNANNRQFNIVPISFRYFNFSFLTKLITLNPNPKTTLTKAILVNEIMEIPQIFCTVDGYELKIIMQSATVKIETPKARRAKIGGRLSPCFLKSGKISSML